MVILDFSATDPGLEATSRQYCILVMKRTPKIKMKYKMPFLVFSEWVNWRLLI
jgi:hypothetical protein